MVKAHSPINWQNKPSVNTPINETNLNKMDSTIGILDDRIIAHDTSKLDKSTAYTMVKDISFNDNNGIFTVTRLNGSTFTIDTRLEKISIDFDYNKETQQIEIICVDGTKEYIDISSLISPIDFVDSDTIGWEVTSDWKVKAKVLNGSITEDMIQPNYLADIKVETAKSAQSMANAKISENNASNSANLAKSYAVGGTGTRDGEDTDNAKYYSENAKSVAQTITGTNPTITNSTKAPIIYLKENGYTEQKTLSGKNLFSINITNFTLIDNSIKNINQVGDVGQATLKAGKTYSLSLILISKPENDTSMVSNINDVADSGGISFIGIHNFNLNEKYTRTYVPTEDCTLSIIMHGNSGGNTFSFQLWIEEGTSTNYEPYCGGMASPNPDYPQEIKGLGDNGTIEVKTVGKNLFRNTLTTHTYNGLTFTVNDDKSVTVNGTATADTWMHAGYANVDNAKKYSLSGCPTGGNWGKYGFMIDSNDVARDYGNGAILVPAMTGKANFIIAVWGGVTVSNLKFYPQLELGEISTPYEPYTETVATIPIDTLYEGDYLEVYADGSGKIVRENNLFYAKTIKSCNKSNDIALLQFETTNPSNTKRVLAKCNSFIQKLAYDFSYEHFYIENDVINLFVRKDRFSNNLSSIQSEFTEYIQSNPIYFVYRLAEPVEIELTAEQVAQFKQLYTFDNVTNFFCDGELTARYYCNTDSGYTVGMLQNIANNSVSKSSIANNLTTTTEGMVLDATQGKALNDKISTLNSNLEWKTLTHNSASITSINGDIFVNIITNSDKIKNANEIIVAFNHGQREAYIKLQRIPNVNLSSNCATYIKSSDLIMCVECIVQWSTGSVAISCVANGWGLEAAPISVNANTVMYR